MKMLIIGGHGFVRKNLAALLRRKGQEVIPLLRRNEAYTVLCHKLPSFRFLPMLLMGLQYE
ncbi:MAG TPA: hypothetical protein VFA77_16210 [Candidatus Eisenbacteria bacterium]|nr:hypothetical protein [Candidatus Eisenbacteria bacterium]